MLQATVGGRVGSNPLSCTNPGQGIKDDGGGASFEGAHHDVVDSPKFSPAFSSTFHVSCFL